MCSFFPIHRQKYARNSGAKVDDPLNINFENAREYVTFIDLGEHQCSLMPFNKDMHSNMFEGLCLNL